MDLHTIKRQYRDSILEIASQCNAENVRIFGSVARGDATKDSDIDFLVHMKPDSGLGICEIQWRLKDLLKCKVDVLPDTTLHPVIKDRIFSEAVPL